MKALYVPFSLDKSSISVRDREIYIDTEIWLATRSLIFIASDFHADIFKAECIANIGHSMAETSKGRSNRGNFNSGPRSWLDIMTSGGFTETDNVKSIF